MSNDYVPDLTSLQPGEVARSADINDRYTYMVAGFDKMPAPYVGDKGFIDPIQVPNPTADGHAINRMYADGRYVNVTGDTLTGTLTATGLTVDGATNADLYLTADGTLGANDSRIYFGDDTSATVGSIAYDHGADALTFAANAAERARIDSSGNLLIGHVDEATWFNNDGFTVRQNGSVNISRNSGTNIFLDRRATDGAVMEFRKDNATVGSIGIRSGGNNSFISFDSGSFGNTGLTGSASGGSSILPTNASGTLTDGALNFGSASQRFKDLHLSGSALIGTAVGIGTTSPATFSAELAVVDDLGTPRIAVVDDATNNRGGYLESNGTDFFVIGTSSGVRGISFNPDNIERARIDVSGNLLVGTTDSDVSNNVTGAGFNVLSSGVLTNAGTGVLYYPNRQGSDGSLIQLRRDGVEVGDVGAGTNFVTIGNGDTRLLFQGSTDQIIPAGSASGALSNGTVDLGSTTSKFKDIHLSGVANTPAVAFNTTRALTTSPDSNLVPANVSGTPQAGGYMNIGSASYPFQDLYLNGGVYLGGTGAANHLDDYEEGTFTATITPSTSGTVTLNSTADTLQYTKIGGLVHISGRLLVSSASSPLGTLQVDTLPFIPTTLSEHSDYSPVTAWVDNTSIAAGNIIGQIIPGDPTLYLYDGSAGTPAELGSALSGDETIYISASYRTA